MGTPQIVKGFLIAPLASGIFQGLIIGNISNFISAFVIVLMFAYIFSLVLGVPTFIIFKILGWLSLGNTVVAGAILGVVSGVIIFGGFGNSSWDSIITGMLLFATHGVIVSATFWWIAFVRAKNVDSTESW